jgi:hypothetical protein
LKIKLGRIVSVARDISVLPIFAQQVQLRFGGRLSTLTTCSLGRYVRVMGLSLIDMQAMVREAQFRPFSETGLYVRPANDGALARTGRLDV